MVLDGNELTPEKTIQKDFSSIFFGHKESKTVVITILIMLEECTTDFMFKLWVNRVLVFLRDNNRNRSVFLEYTNIETFCFFISIFRTENLNDIILKLKVSVCPFLLFDIKEGKNICMGNEYISRNKNKATVEFAVSQYFLIENVLKINIF
jgi:hypothetical protein